MKMRVWAEYFKPEEAMEPGVMKLLKKYDVTLCIAFPPGSINNSYAKMLKKYGEEGMEVALWVLLPDEQGYWVCEQNALEFTDYIKKIYDWSDKKKFSIPLIAVDLELPHYQMEAIKGGKNAIEIAVALLKYARENRNIGRYYEASKKFDTLSEFIHGRGSKTLCPIGNLVVEDMITGSAAFQDMMETPVTTVNWDILSVMIYTSAFVGYSKGLITPADARWYLYTAARDMKERLWDRAGVSIGCTYIGKLGDEPYYATPAELLPDMQAAKAALIDDVTIYNIEGILRYAKPEEWFETLLEAEPKIPPRSLKIDAVRAALQGISRFA